MEYLCFANGRKKDECVKILEAEEYVIDKMTVGFIDSDAIRRKYAAKFSEFQRLYPNGGKGSVRIFGDSIIGENGHKVLYSKHKEAFKHIIQDEAFLRWVAMQDLKRDYKHRTIHDTYTLNGIVIYHRERTRINQYIANLKREDRKQYGIRGGAKRYYKFMKNLLVKYEEYCKYNSKALTVDQIWKQHLSSLQNIDLQHEPIMDDMHVVNEPIKEEPALREIIPGFDDEYEPDYEYLGEEPIYKEPLYDFFQSDYFDRYFSNTFADDEMMVLGDFAVTHDPVNISPWASIANTCFNGNVIACDLEHFTYADSQTFNNSKFITLIGEADTRLLKTLIIQALENKAQVILISNDKELLDIYSKKFKNIIPIYNNPEDNYNAQRAYVDFFVEQYQNTRGYSKR